MTLNGYRDKAYKNAKEKGFHDEPCNLPTQLMLIVSELSEAMEADRKGKWCEKSVFPFDTSPIELSKESYEYHVKGTVEEEIADALIRIFDLAGSCEIDLEWFVNAKMKYNKTRGYKHGKNY